MIVKLFWKNNCPNCPPAKELAKTLEQDGYKVNYYNIETEDGLGEAVYFGLMTTPSFVIVDENNEEIKTWTGNVPTLDEVKSLV